MTAPWHLDGVYDERIKASVYDGNEYRLPADLSGWRVLDIGANVGCFARLAAERGASVLCYEPDLRSYARLLANTAHLPGVTCRPAAISTSAGRARLQLCSDPAGSNLFGIGGRAGEASVPTESIEMAIAAAAGEAGRLDLLKLDAEGIEYAVLESSALPGVVRLLVEFHAVYVPNYEARADDLRRQRLPRLGFREVRFEPAHQEHGWYRLYEGTREG